jgi:hypothetical protein
MEMIAKNGNDCQKWKCLPRKEIVAKNRNDCQE